MSRRSSKMLVGEERKLSKLLRDVLIPKYGLTQKPGADHKYTWVGHSNRFHCSLEVTPIVSGFSEYSILTGTGHPWLACRFQRPYPRPDLPWDAPENYRKYGDIDEKLGSVNPHTGKYNSHVFDRMTAEESLNQFDSHLSRALDPVTPGETDAPEVTRTQEPAPRRRAAKPRVAPSKRRGSAARAGGRVRKAKS